MLEGLTNLTQAMAPYLAANLLTVFVVYAIAKRMNDPDPLRTHTLLPLTMLLVLGVLAFGSYQWISGAAEQSAPKFSAKNPGEWRTTTNGVKWRVEE